MNRTWVRKAVPYLLAAVVAVSVFALTALLRHRGYFVTLETIAYDLMVNQLSTDETYQDKVVIIGIDAEDVKHLKHYPVSDAEMLQMIQRLLTYEPRGIGIDILRDLPVPPGNEEFNAFLETEPRVVCVWKPVEGADRVEPPPGALKSGGIGFANQPVDPDGTLRRALLYMSDPVTEGDYPSLSLHLALLFLAGENVAQEADPDDNNLMKLGRTTYVPIEPSHGNYVDGDTGGYQYLIDFRGTQRFTSFRMRDLLPEIAGKSPEDSKIKREDIEGKIIFIGTLDEEMKDLLPTPRRPSGNFGVECQAVLVETLIRGALKGATPVRSWSDSTEVWWVLLWSVLGAAAGSLVWSPVPFAMTMLGGLGVLGLSAWTMLDAGCWVPAVTPALAWSIAGPLATTLVSYRERQNRKLVMKLFGQHVSPQVARQIWDARDQILHDGRLKPVRLRATVLFSDLVGFTSICESQEPVEAMKWLDRYMERMTACVLSNGGMVDKFIGDAVMAVFGAPEPRKGEDEVRIDAVNAVRCALAMREEIQKFNDTRPSGWPQIAQRIGVYTGDLVAGTLGTDERLEYVLLGDTVNTASRLESYDKSLMGDLAPNSTRILVGGTTKVHLDNSFSTRPVATDTLKGKEHAVEIHAIIGQNREPMNTPEVAV